MPNLSPAETLAALDELMTFASRGVERDDPAVQIIEPALDAIESVRAAFAEIEALRKKYEIAVGLHDAAAADEAGLAGAAFSCHVPIELIEGKTPSELVTLICERVAAHELPTPPQEPV